MSGGEQNLGAELAMRTWMQWGFVCRGGGGRDAWTWDGADEGMVGCPGKGQWDRY